MSEVLTKIQSPKLKELFNDREVIETFISAPQEVIVQCRQDSYEIAIANGYYASELRSQLLSRIWLVPWRRLILIHKLKAYIRRYKQYVQSIE